MTLEEQLGARLAADDDLDDGWAGTILIEPLTALAGGIIGGALVGALAWRNAGRLPNLLEADRNLRRIFKARR